MGKKIEAKFDFNLSKVKAEIEKKFEGNEPDEQKSELLTQELEKPEKNDGRYILTGVPGFDELLEKGIPKGSNVIVVGGAGSGKTIFCLQMLFYHAAKGKKCLFISFEESRDRLIQHMKDFGWNPEKLLEAGNLKINRYLTTDIYYRESSVNTGVRAMIAKSSSHLSMDLEPFVIGDEGFNPDIVILDSLTAISSTFVGKDRGYRFYVERLFRFFEEIGSTNFLISEPTQKSDNFFQIGSEEFLSDGVIVLYNMKRKNFRERGLEILKMRGAKHQEKIVALEITKKGITVYPEQEVYGNVQG